MCSSWKMVAVTSALSGLIGTTSISYLLAQVGIGERIGLLLAATIMCTVCSVVVYHQGIEEGISAT
ncbi:MAG: hypothetical protein EKK31_14450 [Hyphomicrobiales bacterium]|nr:MAG: hypothetical protein EKK31_14450 [Hyphomicrobiales bacterium]